MCFAGLERRVDKVVCVQKNEPFNLLGLVYR